MTDNEPLGRARPATVLGATCLPAGVFLTVRSMLAAVGADVSDVAPSTALAEYARRHLDVFLGPVSRLAPGALPPVKVRTPVYDACCAGALVGFVGTLAGWWTGSAVVSVAAALVFAASYAGAWVAARWMLPSSVAFGRLATFRDLSLAIARGTTGERDRNGLTYAADEGI